MRRARELPQARKQTQAPEHAATPKPHRGGPRRRGALEGPGEASPGERRRKPGTPFTPVPPEARPHGGPGTRGRRRRPSFPHPSQLLPTWRRPWPPGAGPRGRRAAGQQAGGGAGAALPGRRAQGLARASRAPHPASAPAPPVIRGERLSAAVAGSGQSFAPPGGAAAARAGAVHSPRSAT